MKERESSAFDSINFLKWAFDVIVDAKYPISVVYSVKDGSAWTLIVWFISFN